MIMSSLPAIPLLDAAGAGYLAYGILGFVALGFLAPFIVMAVILIRRAVRSKKAAAPPKRET